MKAAPLSKLEANAPDIARTLRLLANEERVRILCRLAATRQELSHAELAESVPISQSALSQHLTKLRNGGIISARRAGHNFFYRVADLRAVRLASVLQEILKRTDALRPSETIDSGPDDTSQASKRPSMVGL